MEDHRSIQSPTHCSKKSSSLSPAQRSTKRPRSYVSHQSPRASESRSQDGVNHELLVGEEPAFSFAKLKEGEIPSPEVWWGEIVAPYFRDLTPLDLSVLYTTFSEDVDPSFTVGPRGPHYSIDWLMTDVKQVLAQKKDKQKPRKERSLGCAAANCVVRRAGGVIDASVAQPDPAFIIDVTGTNEIEKQSTPRTAAGSTDGHPKDEDHTPTPSPHPPTSTSVEDPEEDDTVCEVCGSGESVPGNVIIFCEKCNLAVHQYCYGVEAVPEEDWFCKPCSLGMDPLPQCCMCPEKGGPLKPSLDGRWAHVCCALWVPETHFQDALRMEPVGGIDEIPKSRWRLSCIFCKKTGACIQCSSGRCVTAFHVTCGIKHKMLMLMVEAPSGVVMYCTCEKHRPDDVNALRESLQKGTGPNNTNAPASTPERKNLRCTCSTQDVHLEEDDRRTREESYAEDVIKKLARGDFEKWTEIPNNDESDFVPVGLQLLSPGGEVEADIRCRIRPAVASLFERCQEVAAQTALEVPFLPSVLGINHNDGAGGTKIPSETNALSVDATEPDGFICDTPDVFAFERELTESAVAKSLPPSARELASVEVLDFALRRVEDSDEDDEIAEEILYLQEDLREVMTTNKAQLETLARSIYRCYFHPFPRPSPSSSSVARRLRFEKGERDNGASVSPGSSSCLKGLTPSPALIQQAEGSICDSGMESSEADEESPLDNAKKPRRRRLQLHKKAAACDSEVAQDISEKASPLKALASEISRSPPQDSQAKLQPAKDSPAAPVPIAPSPGDDWVPSFVDLTNVVSRAHRLRDEQNCLIKANEVRLQNLMRRKHRELFMTSQLQMHRNRPGAGEGEAEDVVCNVCQNGEIEDGNVIVFCDKCGVAVHQACYGVPSIPPGPWMCRYCESNSKQHISTLECAVCPVKGGAFKRSRDGRWVHVVCALWIPELRIVDHLAMEPIEGLGDIPKARYKLTCVICKKRNGACVVCTLPCCKAAFHPLCARYAGYYLTLRDHALDQRVDQPALVSPGKGEGNTEVNRTTADQDDDLASQGGGDGDSCSDSGSDSGSSASENDKSDDGSTHWPETRSPPSKDSHPLKNVAESDQGEDPSKVEVIDVDASPSANHATDEKVLTPSSNIPQLCSSDKTPKKGTPRTPKGKKWELPPPPQTGITFDIFCRQHVEQAYETDAGLEALYDGSINTSFAPFANRGNEPCNVCGFMDAKKAKDPYIVAHTSGGDDEDETVSDSLLECAACGCAVHRGCYGVNELADDQWLCDPCAAAGGQMHNRRCKLCPVLGGALKRTQDRKGWAHVLCGVFIPETKIVKPRTMGTIGNIDEIPPQRWSLVCRICKEKYGACVQCSKASCAYAYHPLCARKLGNLLRIEPRNKEIPTTPSGTLLDDLAERFQSTTDAYRKAAAGEAIPVSFCKRHSQEARRLEREEAAIQAQRPQIVKKPMSQEERIDLESTYISLRSLRMEVESARLLVDMVKRREKFKRRLVQLIRPSLDAEFPKEFDEYDRKVRIARREVLSPRKSAPSPTTRHPSSLPARVTRSADLVTPPTPSPSKVSHAKSLAVVSSAKSTTPRAASRKPSLHSNLKTPSSPPSHSSTSTYRRVDEAASTPAPAPAPQTRQKPKRPDPPAKRLRVEKPVSGPLDAYMKPMTRSSASQESDVETKRIIPSRNVTADNSEGAASGKKRKRLSTSSRPRKNSVESSGESESPSEKNEDIESVSGSASGDESFVLAPSQSQDTSGDDFLPEVKKRNPSNGHASKLPGAKKSRLSRSAKVSTPIHQERTLRSSPRKPQSRKVVR